MLTVLKEITKQLPHPLLMRSYHYWHVKEHRTTTRQAAKKAGVPMLDRLDLSTVKTSDTLFILGSGASINDISPEGWINIAKHDSVGFNFWPLHPFVPRMYFFESIQYNLGGGDEETEVFRTVMRMLTNRAEAYKNVIKVITDVRLNQDRQLIYQLPSAWKTNLYAAYTVPPVARTPEELDNGVRYLKGNGAFAPAQHIDWLFKYCGSLSTMIALGVRMQYRRIVLCGIDMGMQHYFFQDPKLFPHTSKYEFVPRFETHHTAVGRAWMVPMQDVVATLMKEVLKPAGIELYLENPNSALWPMVPTIPPDAFN